MDEQFRKSLMEVYEHHKSRVLKAKDPDDINKATQDWQKSAELILKFDTASDTHDENIEKIINSQNNDEVRRENDIKIEEVKIKNAEKQFKKEFWKDIAKTAVGFGIYAGIAAFAFYFDGKGVIFTSTVGKQIVSSATKKIL